MPCSPVLLPLLLDVPVEDSGFVAGPFVLPASPLTPGPELSDDGGMFVESSAANAGTAAKRAANAVAAIIFFMAFPSSNLSLTENQRRGCLRVPRCATHRRRDALQAIASEEKTEASWNSVQR